MNIGRASLSEPSTFETVTKSPGGKQSQPDPSVVGW